jgi:hypothetical protein
VDGAAAPAINATGAVSIGGSDFSSMDARNVGVIHTEGPLLLQGCAFDDIQGTEVSAPAADAAPHVFASPPVQVHSDATGQDVTSRREDEVGDSDAAAFLKWDDPWVTDNMQVRVLPSSHSSPSSRRTCNTQSSAAGGPRRCPCACDDVREALHAMAPPQHTLCTPHSQCTFGMHALS